MPATPRRRPTSALVRAAALTAALALSLALPAGAQALLMSSTMTKATASTCTAPTSQPFAPWGDVSPYSLITDGSFEAKAAAWSLANGAAVVTGNEPYRVNAPTDALALRLPAGASATSPPVCLTTGSPTMRFFTRDASLKKGQLTVDIIGIDAFGNTWVVQYGKVRGSSSWAPSPIFATGFSAVLLPGETTAVRFRFTAAQDGSDWRLDDVYVDPRMRY